MSGVERAGSRIQVDAAEVEQAGEPPSAGQAPPRPSVKAPASQAKRQQMVADQALASSRVEQRVLRSGARGDDGGVLTTHIKDRNLRAAAELVDRTLGGDKGDREVTAKDVAKMEALLEKGKLGDLRPIEVDLLRTELPKLSQLLAGSAPLDDKAAGKEPFCRSLWVTAIADPEVHACAKAISDALGGGKEELSLATFLDARDAVEGRATPGSEARIAGVRAKLEARIADGTITADTVRSLDMFFLEGVGGLLSFGPVRIGSRDADDVYRLPTHGVREKALEGEASPSDVDWAKEYAGLIDEYEGKFGKLAYDRVYIAGADGELFIALNKMGKIDDVENGYRVSMRNDEHKSDSGVVIRKVEVANSWAEATWGVWKDGVLKLADFVSSVFRKKLDKKIDKAVGGVVDSVGAGADPAKKLDLKSVSVAVTFATVLGSAAVNLPAVIAVAGIGAGGTTAASVAAFLAKSHDKAPIFHAMGVTVNRPGDHSY